MAVLLAMSHVRVLAPRLDSGEVAHRMFQDQEEQRFCAITGCYVYVGCEKELQQHSAMSLRCTEVMGTTQNKD